MDNKVSYKSTVSSRVSKFVSPILYLIDETWYICIRDNNIYSVLIRLTVYG